MASASFLSFPRSRISVTPSILPSSPQLGRSPLLPSRGTRRKVVCLAWNGEQRRRERVRRSVSEVEKVGYLEPTGGGGVEEVLEKADGFSWENLPQRYKIIGATFLAFVTCNMDKVNLSIAIIPMSHQFGWNSYTAGLVQSSFFRGYALGQLPGRWLAKIFNGRRVLEVGALAWSLATAFVPVAAGFMPALILSRILAQGLHPLFCFKNEDEGLSCNHNDVPFIQNTPNEKLDDSGLSFESEDLSCNCNNLHFGETAPSEKLDNNELCSGTNKKSWFLTMQKHVYNFFQSYSEPWVVPWKAETVIQVMMLWIASFWFVGSWVIPFLAHTAGFRKEVLTHRGQALYSLLTDMAEGLAGIAILHRCLARFRPLPSGWFNFRWKGNWPIDVLMGCLMFPLVTSLSQLNIDLVPVLPASPVGVSSVEQSIVARDPVAMALYAIVVSVCAPVWEEIVFRGFLLPSLTRYMPLWSSILLSAVAFALAHFNVQRVLPLVFLGVVMGAIFARTRNLFASMLLHSLWNGFVFLELMK